jgi:Skp family chaperone for outer membrane proteins
MRLVLIVSACITLAAGANAQTMFKCVSADGKITYSDQPCAGKAALKKEFDIRADLADIERANRRKADLQRESDLALIKDESAKAQAVQLSAFEQMKLDTQKRVQADQEERAAASRLWNCKRGPKPELCK